jgi:hypothetical protein
VLCVRWYLRYCLTLRDLEELMTERGLSVDHSTIGRWVLRYAPELNKPVRREIRTPNRSWRVDETYVRVAGVWTYLYRAVDSTGETIDFMRLGRCYSQILKRLVGFRVPFREWMHITEGWLVCGKAPGRSREASTVAFRQRAHTRILPLTVELSSRRACPFAGHELHKVPTSEAGECAETLGSE